MLSDAELLKTERGRKNRYVKYFDRFTDCYVRLPETAAMELDNMMNNYDIQFTVDEKTF